MLERLQLPQREIQALRLGVWWQRMLLRSTSPRECHVEHASALQCPSLCLQRVQPAASTHMMQCYEAATWLRFLSKLAVLPRYKQHSGPSKSRLQYFKVKMANEWLLKFKGLVWWPAMAASGISRATLCDKARDAYKGPTLRGMGWVWTSSSTAGADCVVATA